MRELVALGFRLTADVVGKKNDEPVYRMVVSHPESGRTSPPFTGPYEAVWGQVAKWAHQLLEGVPA